MRCLFVVPNRSRAEPFAGILAAEGYEVDIRVARAGATTLADTGALSLAFLDLELGCDVMRSLCSSLRASNVALPPVVAVIGEPKSYEEVDAIIAMGTSMYVEADAGVFKKRVRFLRSAMKVRNRASSFMEEVRTSENRYRTVVAALDEGLLVQQRDGTVTATNPAAGRILGLEDEEVRASRWREGDWDIIDEDGDRVPVEELPWLRAMESNEPVRGCMLGLRKPGASRVWISVNSHPVTNDHVSPVAVVTTFSDVTARRLAEERLLELLESAPDAVLLHRNGKTLWTNKRWAELLGYEDPKSLVGKPMMEYIAPRFRPIVAERLDKATKRQVVQPSMEQALLHADGSEVLVVIYGLFTVYRGEPALCAFARDRTEQRRLEMQLMAADRLAALGRLVAGVGHEINNPLAYVIGNVQLALDRLRSGQSADAIERLEEVLDGAERIRLIVRDLRVFGSHAPQALSAVDLHAVIDSCARVAESEIRLRAKLLRDFGNVPSVMASEPRLAQVILNLLVNAIQSIPDDRTSEHTVTVSTRMDPDGKVALRITDTGVGIDPEDLPRVTEPFFTTKADKGGTGLGLSICNMLVADQGGELAIDSVVGRGTTVTVRLQAAEGAAGDADPNR